MAAEHKPTRPVTVAPKHAEMIAVAKRQGVVLLANGRTARLIFWPVPQLRRRLAGGTNNRARVEYPGGGRASVRPEDVLFVLPEPFTPDPADDGMEIF